MDRIKKGNYKAVFTDIDGTLYRIQCKTAMLVDEKATAISFPTANIMHHPRNGGEWRKR